MTEIYLFVNPSREYCFKMEQQLLQFIEEEYRIPSKEKMQFRSLPLISLQTVGDVMQRKGISQNNLEKRNHLFSTTYSAALDCKAVQFQGKKRGRHSLIRLQEAVGCNNIPYSHVLAEPIFEEIGGDLSMFKEDRQSDFVKEVFFSDQKIAWEMGIMKHPFAVVYNYTCDRGFSVLVGAEGTSSLWRIKELCKTTDNSYQIFNGEHLHTNGPQFHSWASHLRLLSN